MMKLDNDKNDYFFSMVRGAPVKKRRLCLGCAREFNSMNIGNRICSTCAARNSRAGKLKAHLIAY